MTNKQKTIKIIKFARLNGFDGAKKTKLIYKGCEVWEPYFNSKEPMCVGLPISILVNDDEMRFTNKEETFEVLHLLYPDEE